MEKKELWVVIPIFNEAARIGPVVKSLVAKKYQVLVVDDGSSDDGASVAKKAGADIFRLAKNSGKGVALRTGFDEAVKRGAKFLITIDGDGQHDPDDVKLFVSALDKGFDVIFSRRDFSMMPFLAYFANWFLSLLAVFFFKVNIHDTLSGMHGFTRQSYRICRWKSTDYAMETEIVARTGLNNLKYSEVIIRTIYPKKVKGAGAVDAVKILIKTVIWRLFPSSLRLQ